jgi:Flp pilus assembly protein TadB
MSDFTEKFKAWKSGKPVPQDNKESDEVETEIEIKRTKLEEALKKPTSIATEPTSAVPDPEHSLFKHDKEPKEQKSFIFSKAKHAKSEHLTKSHIDEKKKEIKKDVFKVLKAKRKVMISKRKQLRYFLNRAGYEDVDDVKFKTTILYKIPIILCSIFTIITIIMALIIQEVSIFFLIFFIIIGIWILGYAIILILEFLLVYLYLDNRTYKRKKELEAVLADFLQLTSSNISAGMPVDKALWFAVRPKFGVLAREIEEVAKATLTGEDLAKALKTFAAKYDSVVLNRSISLLLEGMQGGGEIADLLNKIALNIQQTRIMKKQMAADVLTYVIFITFASVLISPFLFALSTQLLTVITTILGNIGSQGSNIGMFSISTSGTLKVSDFKWFVILMLFIGSTFSSLIIATIQKGNAREGIKRIPVAFVISLALYLLADLIMGSLLGSLITTG